MSALTREFTENQGALNRTKDRLILVTRQMIRLHRDRSALYLRQAAWYEKHTDIDDATRERGINYSLKAAMQHEAHAIVLEKTI